MANTILRQWVSTAPQAVWKEKRATERIGGAGNMALSGERYQTWQGTGGCFNEIGWRALAALPSRQQKTVMAEIFDRKKGCKFNFCRLPIGASDYAEEWYSYDEADGDFDMRHFSIERDRTRLIPYVKLAQGIRPDLKFFASPWSPPTWLKYPKAMNNGRPIMDKPHLDALALYYVKYVKAYEKEGIPVQQIHIMNEPASRHHKFPMCEWDGHEMRDFIKNHLGPAFQKHGIDAEMWFSTLNTSDYNGFVNTALSDPKALQYISGVGLQWEGRNMVHRCHAAWPDMPLMATENECGDGKNTWEYAQYVYDMIWEYVSGGVVGYTYWNMILPEGGMSTWAWYQNSMVTIDPGTKAVTYQPEFYVMKHLSAFVEPGAVCVGLAGEWTGTALAFQNPNNELVIIVNNPFVEARTLSFRAGKAGFDAILPAKSYNTFVL